MNKNNFIPFFLLFLFLFPSCTPTTIKEPDPVIVTAVLNILYWEETNTIFTLDQLDNFDKNPTLIYYVENQLNVKLTYPQIMEVVKQRNTLSHTYNR